MQSNDSNPTVPERYARATISSNLRDSEHHHATDVLAAVALSSDMGSLLFRVRYGLDASCYKPLREAWIAAVTKKADIRHWPTNIKPANLAVMVLDFWLNDICNPCNGLGYTKHEHAPSLTDQVCTVCNGSGKIEFKCERSVRKYAEDILEELPQIAIDAEKRAIKRLAKEIDI